MVGAGEGEGTGLGTTWGRAGDDREVGWWGWAEPLGGGGRQGDGGDACTQGQGALTAAPASWSALSSCLDWPSCPPRSFSSVCFLSD